MWVVQLNETEGEIKNIVEYIKFREDMYISWESERQPKSEWISKAEETIFIKKEGCNITDDFKYKLSNITPIVIGVVRKQIAYEIKTTLVGRGEFSLLHLVLPILYLPEDLQGGETFSPPLPAFVKKKSLRIAMTWSFAKELSIGFRFRKASQKEFDNYKAVGDLRTIIVNSETLREAKRKAVETGKDLLAKFAAEVVKP